MDYKDFSSINSVDTLCKFFEEKKFTHTKYCHYSGIKGIDSILDKQFFWLSECNSVNDKAETTDKNEYFVCFSATDSENIPMWYFYGGIDGNGVRLTFKKSLMKKWFSRIEQKSSVLLVKYKDENYSEVDNRTPVDYSVRCSDVLYLSNYEEDSSLRIKYNNHSNYSFAKEQEASLREKFKGAVKEVPWFYEKEFRVIVTVSDEIVKKLEDKTYKLVLSFDEDILSDMDIMTGPEQTGDIDTSAYNGFLRYMQQKIGRSKFKGKINMNLKNRLCGTCELKKSDKKEPSLST